MKLTRTYKFAFKSSSFLSIIVFLLVGVFSYFFFESINYWFVLLTSLCFFALSFFIIQFRVEQFIYKRVKKIYNEVSLLDVSDLDKWDCQAAGSYGVRSIPKTFLLDKEGNIAAINPRFNLDEAIEQVLANE